MRSLTLFIACLTLNFSAPANAHDLEFGLGLSTNAFLYNEELTAPSKSSETAVYAAYLAQLRFSPGNMQSYLQIRYEGTGSVRSQYVGSDLDTNAPIKTVDTLQFGQLEGTLNLSPWNGFYVYGGYGYRMWDRDLAGSPGYEEVYSWFYMPVGIQIFPLDTKRFRYGLDVSLRPTSNGIVDVITSKTYSGGQNTKLNLGSRTGYRISLPIEKRLQTFGWSLTPWFEHSAIGESNSAANSTLAPTAGETIYEPNSHTDQFGVEAMLIIRF